MQYDFNFLDYYASNNVFNDYNFNVEQDGLTWDDLEGGSDFNFDVYWPGIGDYYEGIIDTICTSSDSGKPGLPTMAGTDGVYTHSDFVSSEYASDWIMTAAGALADNFNCITVGEVN
jgi:hypothetical protein